MLVAGKQRWLHKMGPKPSSVECVQSGGTAVRRAWSERERQSIGKGCVQRHPGSNHPHTVQRNDRDSQSARSRPSQVNGHYQRVWRLIHCGLLVAAASLHNDRKRSDTEKANEQFECFRSFFTIYFIKWKSHKLSILYYIIIIFKYIHFMDCKFSIKIQCFIVLWCLYYMVAFIQEVKSQFYYSKQATYIYSLTGQVESYSIFFFGAWTSLGVVPPFHGLVLITVVLMHLFLNTHCTAGYCSH